MNDLTSLSKDQLLELLMHRERQFEAQLHQREDALERQRQQLRDQVRQQDIELQTKKLKIEKLDQENQEWELAYNKLLQQAFGRRSERYLEDPSQLRLDFGDTPAAADPAAGLAAPIEDQQQTISEYQRRRHCKKRDDRLPEHLPRYEVTPKFPRTRRFVQRGQRKLLPEWMWDKTETLEFERPKLRVRVTRYPKYACANEPERTEQTRY